MTFEFLDHQYLFQILKHIDIGVPDNFIRATQMLYRDNSHQLELGSELFASITLPFFMSSFITKLKVFALKHYSLQGKMFMAITNILFKELIRKTILKKHLQVLR